MGLHEMRRHTHEDHRHHRSHRGRQDHRTQCPHQSGGLYHRRRRRLPRTHRLQCPHAGGDLRPLPRGLRGTTLHRKKLGAIVFQDEKALHDLDAIIQKYVTQATREKLAQAEAQGKPAAAIDAIKLLESGLADLCHCTLAVTAPEELRVRRIMAREGISEEYAWMRVNAQHKSDWFRERCDHTLESTEADTVETFAQRARTLFRTIMEE